MTFEYPIAFLIVPLFIICKVFCPLKSDSLIFPFTKPFEKYKKISTPEVLIVIFLSTALASPIKTEILKNQNTYGYDIVTVLDTSASMSEQKKLENAKAIVWDFAKNRKNDSLGLVIFGNIAYIASPITFDKKNFKDILERIFPTIAGGKTAMYDALFMSTELFKKTSSKSKIIILITDGQDNASITPFDVVVKNLKNKKIKVYTIGLGFDVNSEILKKISLLTDGKYYHISNISELKKIFKSINSLEKSEINTKVKILKHYYFIYPLLIGILIYIWFLFKYRRNIWNF
ncbi:VWA domain-containing protein [Caminibacter profundus]